MVLALALHLLSAVIWVGGMFFAYVALRPVAAELLEPPLRLRLWRQVFARFFVWVSLAVVLLLCSGLWMIFGFYGGMGNTRPYVHVMLLLGIIMMLIYAHVFFAPYRRLIRAVESENWSEGGVQLGKMRKLIALNLTLGLIVVVVASAGRYI
ncbi:MAG: CopD family protein [Pseudomonadota bacterium]|nr:CopD family protein [Pseudomonadota bacterium]